MKLKCIHLFLTLLVMKISSLQCFTQSALIRPCNVIGVNLLGNGSLASLQYERMFMNKPRFFMSSSVGVGMNQEFALFTNSKHQYVTFCSGLTANLGKKYTYFEIGIGATALVHEQEVSACVYPTLGFRLHPIKRKDFSVRFFHQFPFTVNGANGEGRNNGLMVNEVIFCPLGIQLGVSF